MAKILVVEDDRAVADSVLSALQLDHHTAECVSNCQDAKHLLKVFPYDLVILDLVLPDGSGLDLCRDYRAGGGKSRILMLTGQTDIESKEVGLDLGADDYLTKPFVMRELSARVRALLRRPHDLIKTVLRCGNIIVDPRSRRVTKDGEEIHLLRKEFDLLEFFLRHPGQVFSANALIDEIWQSDTETSVDSVRQWLSRLRKKIDTAGQPSLIETLPAVGYRLTSPISQDSAGLD